MKRERRQKPANLSQTARHAERRYLERGTSRVDELTNIRVRTTENLCRALFEVLTGAFDVSEDQYDAMARTVDGCSRQYRSISEKLGMDKAEKWILEQLGTKKRTGFVLPMDKAPESKKDWENLTCKRAAGVFTVRFYIYGMRKTLKMDDQKIDSVLDAAKERYRQICSSGD